MKTKSALRAFLLGCSSLLAASSIQAATFYWDATPGTPDGSSQGGAGTWNTTTGNWDDGAAYQIWNNGNNDTAVLGGAAGAVALGTGISVGGLRFDTNGYAISSDTAGLSFGAANNTILLAGNANATITGTVGGTGNVILGPLPALGRTLTLNGTSTGGWSGSTTVNLGSTMALAASNQGLVNTSGIILNGGGITLTNTNSTEGALDRVSDSAPVTANGGTITFTNTSDANTYAETLDTVALAIGQTGFSLATNQLGGGTQTLTLDGLTRNGTTNTSNVVFSAATTSPNATTNKIVVNGATQTTAGEIVGPWATTGTAANVQTDYAVYDASALVIPAAIAASTEDSWMSATSAYTTAGVAVALTGNRTMSALRNTGATAIITLSDGVTGFTLATNGILNAHTSQFTIAPGAVAGALTAPGTAGGHIYINTGGSRAFGLTTNNNTIAANLSIDISAAINDNGGPVTLVKTGDTSVLRLTGTNNYSGGTVINSGILLVGADSALGASSGSITLNGGQLRFSVNSLTLNRDLIIGPAGGNYAAIGNANNINFEGKLTGTGTLNMVDTGGAGGRYVYFNSTANDFTGAIILPSNSSKVRVNSLVDSSGAGDIIFYKSGGTAEATFEYGAGATAPLTLSNRSIQIISNTGTAFSSVFLVNSNTTQPFTVTKDIISIGSTARTLTLNAVAGPINAIAGKLKDGAGGGVFHLNKSGVGTWALSGTNTHTGVTTISAGTLVANSIANGGAASSIGASSSQSGSLVLFGGTLKYEPIATVGGTGSTTDRNLIIRSSSTIDASGTGALVFGQTGTVSPDVTDLPGTFTATNATVTGLSSTANLAVGMTVTSGAFTGTKTISSINSASSITLNNGTGIVAGSFSITAGYPAARTLTLTGTNTGNNTIAGVLQNSTAAGSGVLTVAKTGIGTWVLSGINTYTGTTTVSGGTLSLGVDDCLADASNVVIGSGTLAAAAAVNDTAGTLDVTAATSTINLGPGATLAFAASDLVDWSGGTLNITGTFVPGNLGSLRFGTSDTALTDTQLGKIVATGWTSFDLDANGYLTAVPDVSNPYGTWATGSEPFDGDANGDGVQDGLAWFLGAATPAANALGKLPAPIKAGAFLTLTFQRVSPSSPSKLYVQFGNNLSSWTEVEIPATTGTIDLPGDDVEVEVTPGSPESVTVRIPISYQSASGDLFARLRATDN